MRYPLHDHNGENIDKNHHDGDKNGDMNHIDGEQCNDRGDITVIDEESLLDYNLVNTCHANFFY